MTEPQTCEACGQPILIPLRMFKCEKCGKELMNEGGRYAKVGGVCLPFCLGCAPRSENAPGALEQRNTLEDYMAEIDEGKPALEGKLL